jgi:hypothetical protein
MSSHTKHTSSSTSTKAKRFWCNFFAFFLYLLIFALGVAICAKAVFVNDDYISKIFTNKDYVASYYDDVLQYAHDACNEASIPYDSVDSVMTYDVVSEIAISYGEGNFLNCEEYTDTTYQDKIDDLNTSLVSETEKMLDDYGIKINKSQTTQGVNDFSARICDYVTQKTVFQYADNVKKIVNIANVASVVMIVILAILILITTLAIFSISGKKYRGVRSIAYSFISASALSLVMVLAYAIIKSKKQLYIFPVYFCNSVMAYISSCVISLAWLAVALLFIALVLIAIVWKLKRDKK